MRAKLIASSNSIEQLRHMIATRYWYCGDALWFKDVGGAQWEAWQNGKQCVGFRVVLKRGRYRFEAII